MKNTPTGVPDTSPEPTFESPAQKEGFREWAARVASEMDLAPPGETPAHEEVLAILIGAEDEPGMLYPDENGYPNFYGFPFVEQKEADNAVYYLYDRAFEPEERTEHDCGRTAAYIRTYATVDVMDKGQISCAGVLTARHALGSLDAGVDRGLDETSPMSKPAHLPATLVFHESFFYIRDLACVNEAELLNLYRAIRSSKVGPQIPQPQKGAAA